MEESESLAIHEISEHLSLTEALDAMLLGIIGSFYHFHLFRLFSSFSVCCHTAILPGLTSAPFGRSADVE